MRMADLIYTLVWTKFGFEHPKLWAATPITAWREWRGSNHQPGYPNPHPHATPSHLHTGRSMAQKELGHLSGQRKQYSFSKLKTHNSEATISDSKVPARYKDNLCFQNRELINYRNVVMGGGECVTQMLWRRKPRLLLSVPNTSTVVNQLPWFPGMEAASVRSCPAQLCPQEAVWLRLRLLNECQEAHCRQDHSRALLDHLMLFHHIRHASVKDGTWLIPITWTQKPSQWKSLSEPSPGLEDSWRQKLSELGQSSAITDWEPYSSPEGRSQ